MQKNAFHTLSYGVYAVTAMDGERPVGCIANSAMQITSQPPTLAISINQQNYTHDIIQKTGKLALCVLPEQTDLSVIGTFGFQSSREVEKFAEIAYDQKDGLPVLKQCCAWFTLEVVQQMNAGTHTVFLAKVLDCDRTTAICILSQRSQNEKPESCSNLCGRISGNSREKIRPCGNTGADFFGMAIRSKHPIPCQKCLSMPIFAGISSICRGIVSLFSKNASDFIASWWKSSGNSHEKNPSV